MNEKQILLVNRTRGFRGWFACMSLFLMTAFIGVDFGRDSGQNQDILLIVRADDMGITQSTNQAIIESYLHGIVTSAEVIVPGPWFLDAVDLLRQHPDLDVGIHLTLTSEWGRLKWRPISAGPGLVDSNGYLLPVIWQGEFFGADQALSQQAWKLDDIENELRAQIELGLSHLPNISHISCHMGFQSLSPQVEGLLVALAEEYDLIYKTGTARLDFKKERKADSYVPAFLEALEQATPGKYMFVEHPALDGPEMRMVSMASYQDVASDRQKVTDMFTDDRVKSAISRKKITLINYKDLDYVEE